MSVPGKKPGTRYEKFAWFLNPRQHAFMIWQYDPHFELAHGSSSAKGILCLKSTCKKQRGITLRQVHNNNLHSRKPRMPLPQCLLVKKGLAGCLGAWSQASSFFLRPIQEGKKKATLEVKNRGLQVYVSTQQGFLNLKCEGESEGDRIIRMPSCQDFKRSRIVELADIRDALKPLYSALSPVHYGKACPHQQRTAVHACGSRSQGPKVGYIQCSTSSNSKNEAFLVPHYKTSTKVQHVSD